MLHRPVFDYREIEASTVVAHQPGALFIYKIDEGFEQIVFAVIGGAAAAQFLQPVNLMGVFHFDFSMEEGDGNWDVEWRLWKAITFIVIAIWYCFDVEYDKVFLSHMVRLPLAPIRVMTGSSECWQCYKAEGPAGA